MSKATCAWDECDRAAVKRGYCDRDYHRARRAGLIEAPQARTCEDCGTQFVPGRPGSAHTKCLPCRKKRPVCRGCKGPLPLVQRGGPRAGPIVAGYYCSEGCKPRCSIDGCEKPRRKRGWCANHYATWRDHGDPEAKVKHRWSTERRCVVCGITPGHPDWEGVRRKWCSDRCQRLWWKHGGNVPDSIACAKCGVDVPLVVPVGSRRRRRSDTSFCAACIRHARVAVTALQLAEEDGAWCRLCGDPVDVSLKSPHRLSPTVDHIVPRALGGSDERSNLQLAHRSCNSSKRHRYVG